MRPWLNPGVIECRAGIGQGAINGVIEFRAGINQGAMNGVIEFRAGIGQGAMNGAPTGRCRGRIYAPLVKSGRY